MPKGTVVTATFGTATSNGWPAADTGQAWTTIGAGGTVNNSDWAAAGGFGTVSVPVANAYRGAYLPAFSEADVDVAVTFKVNRNPISGGMVVGELLLRGTNATTYYMFHARIQTTGAFIAVFFAPSGAQIGSVTVPNLTYTGTSQLVRLRVQATGRFLRGKVWDTAGSEPAAWPLTVLDDEYTGPGFIGVRFGVAADNTNTKPITASFTNFSSIKVVDFATDKVPVQVLWAPGADLTADWTTWPWADITADVMQAAGQGVSIGPLGRSDEFSTAQPAGATFSLKNFSGKYSAYNPASGNYPNVRRNTPVWVLVGPSTRFFGRAVGFSPSWDASGRAAIVAVTTAGIMRQMQQGSTPIDSPARRGILATNPVIYLPLEDAVGSTQFASAIPGAQPMLLIGDWNLAADSTLPGSKPLPTMTDTSGVAYIVPHQFTTGWQVDWHMKLPSTTLPNPTAETPIMQVHTTGTVMRWNLVIGNDGSEYMAVHGYNGSGDLLVDSGHVPWASLLHNGWSHQFLTAHQNGSNIDWKWVAFPSLGGTGAVIGVNSVAGTWGGATYVTIPASPALAGIGIGHLAAYDAFNFIQPGLPLFGYTGETATDRLTRICDDNGIPLTIVGTSTTMMGAQSTDTLLNNLRDVEAADQGVLLDGLGSGLTYVTRQAKYNQGLSLIIDATPGLGQLAAPFAAVDDDQRTRNSYQVSRKNGSTATYADTDGPMGTNAVGTWSGSLSVNIFSDARLANYAAWLVHQGTAEGFRYPTLVLNLKRSPGLIEDWLGTALQNRIDITNVSAVAPQHSSGTVSLILEGYTETISETRWMVQANCSPYQPWNVAAVGVNFRLEMASQTLAADLAPGATTLNLATATGHHLFTTTTQFPADFPMDLNVGGWQIHVTAASGTSSPQTLTIDPAPIPTTIPAGTTVKLWKAAALAL